ncbi:MAG: hypothetical protein QOF69_4000 [Solirubrobacteraceae bacterium]|nr:hypothetical protein [Solirubrobacteraceae bacterium]
MGAVIGSQATNASPSGAHVSDRVIPRVERHAQFTTRAAQPEIASAVQLVAAMTQRRAHHPMLGQPRRGEIARSELDH